LVKVRRPTARKGGSRRTKALIATGIPATLLLAIIILSLVPRGPDVYPLPTVHFTEQQWMTYVPPDSTLVKFYNFTRIVASPGAQYAVQNNTVIYVFGPNYKVKVDQVAYSVQVFLGASQEVDILALKPAAYQDFYTLASNTFTTLDLGGYRFYQYSVNSSLVIKAYAVFKDSLLFQAIGGPSVYKSVVAVLASHDRNLPDFFSTQERHAEFYLASTTEHKLMGLSVLPNTTAAGTHEWVTAVYDGNDTIDLVNFYAYHSQQNATQMYDTAVKQILSPNYTRDYIIGNFIAQIRNFPWAQARTPINSL